MGASDLALLDAIITFQIDLRRFEAGTLATVMDILLRMQKELVGALANAGPMTEMNKRSKEELLREVTILIDRYYTTAHGEMVMQTNGLADVQAKQSFAALESLAVGLEVVMPTQNVVARLASNALIQGAQMAEWWNKLALDTQFKVQSAIRQGMMQAETNQQIIARIVGKRGFPGIMEISRTNAAAVVQTSVQTVANDARQATFEANKDIIAGYSWVTALDSHVCPLCAARADLTWNVDHEAVGHSIPWQVPPIHFNDRCVLVPKLKVDLPAGQRASETGQVKGGTTFADYLARRGEEFQDKVLGKGRAELWRDGKMTLQDLINGAGNPLTLADLKAKYA